MPNSKSAVKRIKTDEARRLLNNSKKSSIRTYEKKFRTKISEKDFEAAHILLRKTIALYDKAAKGSTIHSNQASRKKSRLTRLYDTATLK